MLVERGASLSHENKFKYTALIWAAEANQVEVASYLLSAGADPCQTESSGNTPLLQAAKCGCLGVLNLLLKTSKRGSKVVDIEHRNFRGDTALLLATSKGHVACVDSLLAAKANVNVPNSDGATPLLMAAYTGSLELCQKLVAEGADVNHVVRKRSSSLSANISLANALGCCV